MTDEVTGALSPYAGGGGGIVLEHVYGAVALASLLDGGSFAPLGASTEVVTVRFQARKLSPVDDLVVDGVVLGPHPVERRISIGVRRDPTIGRSDKDLVALVAHMLEIVRDHNDAVVIDGTWRIGLAVAAPHTGAREVRRLAEIAATQPDADAFRAKVGESGVTTGKVRLRLRYLDQVIEAAAVSIDVPHDDTLTWQLLRGLRSVTIDLEGDDAAGVAACITRLAALTGSLQQAADLFAALVGRASHYATTGATVDAATLRRDLAGLVRVGRPPRHIQAVTLLGELAARVEDRTPRQLTDNSQTLRIDRTDQVTALGNLLAERDTSMAIVVTGDPDVGKSALTLDAVDASAEISTDVRLNLRDLPSTPEAFTLALGTSIAAVLADTPVAPVRLCVIDGAEAVLEGREDVLRTLVTAAGSAGLQVVAITRSDAAPAVTALLPTEPVTFSVAPLDDPQIDTVVSAFPSLARLAAQPGGRWLISRPGLVDLLLRAEVLAALPDGSVSEADMFAAVWQSLVRRDERHGNGAPSPDDRAAVLVELARRDLGGDPPRPYRRDVLPSLRSDGLLLTGTPIAWSTGDSFSSDLIRDLAVARLLVEESTEPLVIAAAPRWALRSARLAAQIRLASAGTEIIQALHNLRSEYDTLAKRFGERWADVPDEALLTLAAPAATLEGLWTDLVADNGAGLRRLLQLVAQRHSPAGVADHVLAAPVVEVCLDHITELDTLPRPLTELVTEVTTGWLRGLAGRGRDDRTDPLRIRLRDTMLDCGIKAHDHSSLERLSLLGPDLDARTEQLLHKLAAERPAFLHPCVEPVYAAMALSVHHPDLLLTLTEAYYIDRPRKPGLFSVRGPTDGGIRRHHREHVGVPFAAWHFGPFWMLLQVRPLETIALINQMLDHAAGYRTAMRESPGTGDPAVTELDLPGIGRRALAGDDQMWLWYRGTGMGPNPCISALFALEQFADRMIEAGIPLRHVCARLLTDSNSLAMPALVVGMLVRHIEQLDDELDGLLAQRLVWDLEFTRSGAEHISPRAQGRDEMKVHGGWLRPASFRDVAQLLTVSALAAGDGTRLDALDSIADQLADGHEHLDIEEGALLRLWASTLRSSSYNPVDVEGQRGFEYRAPAEITDVLAELQADSDRGREAFRLINTYARISRPGAIDLTALDQDLDVGRSLVDEPPQGGPIRAHEAPTAVAAAAVVAHATGQVTITQDKLDWASSVIIGVALHVPRSQWDDEDTIYTTGADRSAASAVPALLLPAFHEEWGDHTLTDETTQDVAEALMALASSPSDEVRRIFGAALGPLWTAPCHPLGAARRCRHQQAFDTIVEGLRTSMYGPWSTDGSRRTARIEGDPTNALAAADGLEIVTTRLTGPLIALCGAVQHGCTTDQAHALLDVVLAAYGRATVQWTAGGYQIHEQSQLAVTEALAALWGAGQRDWLESHVRTSCSDPAALWDILRHLAQVATYNPDRRRELTTLWPVCAQTVFTEIDSGNDPRRNGTDHTNYRAGDVVAALLPRPTIEISDPDPDATLQAATEDWIPLAALQPTIEQWPTLARRCTDAIDAVAGFCRTLPLAEQPIGFDWLDEIIDGHFESFARKSFILPGWLSELLDSRTVQGTRLEQLRRLIDGFVSAGDTRFVALQAADEAAG